MKRFKKILVCVDDPARSGRMFEYAAGRCRLAETQEVHLLHVAEPAAGEEAPADKVADTAVTPETLREAALAYFDEQGPPRIVVAVVPGSALLEPLRYTHDKDIDLILLQRHFGRKADTDEEALLARRITRKATCSVLVLPEEYQVTADALLVPVRDSDCSSSALEVACGIAAITGAPVTALNIYHVGAGYSRVGLTLEEYRAGLHAGAERETERLIERTQTHEVTVRIKCAADVEGDAAGAILREVEAESARAVVIGARGRTGAAGVLLGHVTEKLIVASPVPILAVKKKGECLGIVRALLTLAGQE